MSILKSSLMIVGGEKISLIAFQFISNIILARLLSPDDYGVMSMVAIFISLSSMLVDSGLGGSLIFQKKLDRKDLDTVFWFNILISIFSYLVLYISSDYIGIFYDNPLVSQIIKVMGVIIVLNSLGLVQYSILNRNLKFKQLAFVAVAAYIAAFLLSVYLAVIGYGVWALVAQQVFHSVVMTFMYIAFNRYTPSFSISLKTLRFHWSWGKGLLGSSLIKIIYDNIYLQIMGKYFSLHDAGLFNQANKLKEVPSQLFCKTFENTLFPILSKSETFYFDDQIKKLSSFFPFVIVPIMFAVSLCSPFIVWLLLGDNWLDCSWILSSLAIGAVFSILESINRSALKAKGMTDAIFKLELVKRILGLFIIFISFIISGLVGIIVSFVINSFIGWIFNCYYLARCTSYKLKAQIMDCMRYFIPSIFIAVLGLLFSYHFTPIWASLIHCIFYLSIYTLLYGLSHDINFFFCYNSIINKRKIK